MVNRFFYPFLGGVEFHILNLSLCLTELGHTVTIACRHAEGHPPRAQFRGLDVRRVRGYRELDGLLEEGFDVVHAHMPRNLFSLTGLWFARRRRIGTVLTPHCFYPSTDRLRAAAKRIADRTFTRAVLRLADVTINLTPNDQRDALRCGMPPDRSRIVPNSVRVRELQGVEPVDFRAKHDLPDRFIVHVGRFDPVKNIDFLVRAHRRIEGAGLVLIGQDGGELARIRRLIDESGASAAVRIVERASFAELCGAYRQASALVMASSYEGLPTVFLEAMYFGCPVVAARVGGVPYVLDGDGVGTMFTLHDEDGYVAQLRSILGRGRAAFAAGPDRVSARYAWESNARSIAAVYDEVRGAPRITAAGPS
jgi:glycosyltransferase involved in cell wall biosynthesis